MSSLIFNSLILPASFLVSIIFLKLHLNVASKYNFFSKENNLKVHNKIVPTSGGVAISFSFFLMVLAFSYQNIIPSSYLLSIFLGAGLMAFIGFLDDLFSLSALLRILAQLFFVIFIIYTFDLYPYYSYLVSPLPQIMVFLYLLFFIWTINTFNFIDGADGLLISNTFLISLVSGVYFYLAEEIQLAFILWILAFVSLGFLKFNWAPAKIFMGDSGSLFLGSLFVIFMTTSIVKDQISLWTWLILLSLFLTETTVTLFVRLWRRENVLSGRHELHAYQKLVVKTNDHTSPSKAYLFLQCVWTIPASAASVFFPEFSFYIFLTAILPMIFVFYYFGPGQSE